MLPKIDVPVYSVNLLSNGKTVKFRPFTVKEEKLFLMANEAEEVDSIIETVKQVVNNCVISELDIDSLPIFDFEYLFLNIRAKSIGEIVNLQYKCNNELPDEEGDGVHKCDNLVKIELNILDINIDQKKVENKIEITDKLGMVMKYPTFEILKNYDTQSESEVIIDLTASCIDYIYDSEQIYYAKDSTKEELIEFIENLQTKDLEKIKAFFESMPKMTKQIDFKCNKCQYEEKITLQGIESFFV
jgi:hypothetical protein